MCVHFPHLCIVWARDWQSDSPLAGPPLGTGRADTEYSFPCLPHLSFWSQGTNLRKDVAAFKFSMCIILGFISLAIFFLLVNTHGVCVGKLWVLFGELCPLRASCTNQCIKAIGTDSSKLLVLASSPNVICFSLDFRMLACIVPVWQRCVLFRLVPKCFLSDLKCGFASSAVHPCLLIFLLFFPFVPIVSPKMLAVQMHSLAPWHTLPTDSNLLSGCCECSWPQAVGTCSPLGFCLCESLVWCRQRTGKNVVLYLSTKSTLFINCRPL